MTPAPADVHPPPLPPRESIAGLLRDLIHERTGVYFEASRIDAMLEKLAPRAAAHRCQTWLDYYYILKYDEQGAQEWRRVLDAFSVQETFFWREMDQLRALVDHVVPQWFGRSDRPLRVWSAGCATGEEPYSIAMALREAGWGRHPIEILASDASEAALAKAQARIYRHRSFRALPDALRDKYFEPHDDGQLLRPELGAKVTFRWANLLNSSDLAEAAVADVIFCRNVFIYLSPSAIARVVASFAERLPADGKLFVGSSESLVKLTHEFRLTEIGGAYMYVRQPGG